MESFSDVDHTLDPNIPCAPLGGALVFRQRRQCDWCGAEIPGPRVKTYCSRTCSRRAYRHLVEIEIAQERRQAKVEKLHRIKMLCDALENGGPGADGAHLLDAGLLTWWSVTMSADKPGVFELVTAADRNASVPWALPPPRTGDRAWLIETLREVWLPKAREYLGRQALG
jgi:hypothetical protein